MSVSSPVIETRQVNQVKGRSIESLVVSCVFVLTIFIFGTVSLVRCFSSPDRLSLQENRPVNAFPAVSFSLAHLKAFPSCFDHFYNDRVFARIELVSYLALLKYRLFNVSQNPDALPGNNGWIYYMGQGGADTLHNKPMSKEHLLAWTQVFEERRQWLAKRHIKYLLVFAPFKTSIYPEHLPEPYRTTGGQTRLDQLENYLKQNSQIEVLDLRKPLLQSKNLGELYFKTDGHWNRLGSFIAYKNIVAKLRQWFPALQPLTLADFNPVFNVPHEGDQAKLMGLNQFIIDKYTEYVPRDRLGWKTSDNPQVGALKNPQDFFKPFATEVPNSRLPTAYFLRDSFMTMPQIFISENFRRAYFDWQPLYQFPLKTVEQEHPDVFVQEMVENHIFLLPENPPELKLVSSGKP